MMDQARLNRIKFDIARHQGISKITSTMIEWIKDVRFSNHETYCTCIVELSGYPEEMSFVYDMEKYDVHENSHDWSVVVLQTINHHAEKFYDVIQFMNDAKVQQT